MKEIKMKNLQGAEVVSDQIRIEIEDPHGEWWAVSVSFEGAEALRGFLESTLRILEQDGHVNREQLGKQAQKNHPHLFAAGNA